MINLAENHLNTVRRILADYVPSCEIRAFGSRVRGTEKSWSDLDLAIVGPDKLNFLTLADIREAFEESDLPIQIDVLDWHAITPEFRAVIEANYEILSLN
ncbi:nucleotidyltransferase domain-containing protein [Pontiellaceae bacterium B12219]|nr:nucleotidyltransferase domain-containing protein [Pontiellaceae bacterium B12219]